MQSVGPEFDLGNMADLIAMETGINPITGRTVLSAFAAMLPQALAKYGRAEFHDLGTFRLEQRAADSGLTPDGKEWQTPERLKVVFKASPAVCRAVSAERGQPTY